MGSVIGKGIDEAMKRNRDQMFDMQRMQIERQLEMQNMMRERMMAMQIARSRELLRNWVGPFWGLVTIGCIGAARRRKSPVFLAPIVPLSFVVGYLADLAYGNKIQRIRAISEDILVSEAGLLEFPGGPVTLSAVDQRRLASASTGKQSTSK